MFAGYNYQLFRAPSDHKRVPSRIIVNTESYPRNAFNIWKMVSENNYIIGDFVWTAMDYLGESGIGAWYYPGENAAEHYQGDALSLARRILWRYRHNRLAETYIALPEHVV